MRRVVSHRPRALAVVAGLAVVVAGLVPTGTAQAAPDGSEVVISEVYGGGGNGGAVFSHDFVELYNPTAAAISLVGTSLQYRAAANTGAPGASSVLALGGEVPAGGHVLVRLASGTNPGTRILPVHDITGSINLSGTQGQVFLAQGTTPVDADGAANGPAVTAPEVIDFVGFGSAAVREGDTTAPSPSGNAQSLARAADGKDTDQNGADFTTGAPTPTNSRGEGATDPEPEPGDPDLVSIAQIQGTGAASPLVGRNVTTRGVVTAVLPDPYPGQLGTYGGLDGLFVQTGGTGGGSDATPGASDAVFVYGASALGGLEVGDSVEVTGTVAEFQGGTQVAVQSDGITVLDEALPPVIPLAAAYPTTEQEREAHEGELLAPTDRFTVTNVYQLNQYGEIGLATGDTPLVQPSEVAAPGTPVIDQVKADNAARGVVLDDGTSINYLSTGEPQQDLALPWITQDHSVRVGARATLEAPVVLDWRNGAWKFQPTSPVTDRGTDVATFSDTRADNAAPRPVGGDVKLATFNVLNFFNTTGEAYVAAGGTACTYYEDRDGNPIGNRRCGTVNAAGENAGNGPRGAATQASYERQRAKVVRAVNTLDADVVALEEIENSIKLVGETNRDDALAALVRALNADAGAGTWKFVHSPAAALASAAVGEQDVIRSAYIYRPAAVQPVGQSQLLFGTPEFANAREPLAQAFKATGALDSQGFVVVANHFKSKGDSTPPATGDNADNPDTGAFNGDRVRAAHRLAAFAEDFAESRGVEPVFLVGDFNAYSKEEPIQVLEEAGYELVESPGEETYSFDGLSGSLDHVLANEAAAEMVTGSDVWGINSPEPVAYQYSRYNYNVTELFDADNPFAASDHDPHVVGLDLPEIGSGYTPVQILATNDFHGRLLPDGANAAGAEILSGAVKELREDVPFTTFAAAGDLIGASTFESFIQDDEPTIDALNAAGLEVSAVGNHEFDQGYEDLVGRVQDRADWAYVGTNVDEPEGRDDLAETWTKERGGVTVGFVGAVTEDLPALVRPAGIEGVTVTDIVDATAEAAAELRADGADLVVMLVHEGAPSTDCATMTDPDTTWGNIVTRASSDIDAIVSGHTHLAYNCSFPVEDWADREVTERPVVSAGQYGTNLNRLVFTLDDEGEVVAKSHDVIGLVGTGYPKDPEVTPIVDAAVKEAEVLGAEVLGQIDAPFNRAKLSTGVENRGGESTLGNLVAEVQRWATSDASAGGAQIAFMNPGGLRQDMAGTVNGDARDVTYKQAAVVQPFANTLVNMNLTGADIKLVLEQQWQRDASGNVPSRPFLRLGTSKGFTYTYDPTRPEGERITGMWLEGAPVTDGETYSVTVNSFLATGGDNFRAFNRGTGARDTGRVDLSAMVDYLAEFATDEPLEVDSSQRAVGVVLPDDAPETYAGGDRLRFDLTSLAMTAPGDVVDEQVQVLVDGEPIGTATVDSTPGTDVTDEYGTASVDVILPAGLTSGAHRVTVVGESTGTEVIVPIEVADDRGEATVTAETSNGRVVVGSGKVPVKVRVTTPSGAASGKVQALVDGKVVGSGTLANGRATIQMGPFLAVGNQKVTIEYLGNDGTAPASTEVTVKVVKAGPKVSLTAPAKVAAGQKATLEVKVDATGYTPTGRVLFWANGKAVTVKLDDQGRGKAQVPVSGLWTIVLAAYEGDARTLPGADLAVITVTRR